MEKSCEICKIRVQYHQEAKIREATRVLRNYLKLEGIRIILQVKDEKF